VGQVSPPLAVTPSWQDLRYANGTFDTELEAVDVAEIRKPESGFDPDSQPP